MRIAALFSPAGHQRALGDALVQGILAYGDDVVPYPSGVRMDAAICWGWRSGRRIRRYNPNLPVLVMERGYVGDRFHWTSLGWNGLNGRAVFPKPGKNSRELRSPFDRWRDSWKPGYALILGQVQSDQACLHVDLTHQYRAWARQLKEAGHEVRFRPHPKAGRQHPVFDSRMYAQGTLVEDLAGAKFTVSWNSNASVDSVLAGVPSVTLDEGAMAWAVTSHDLHNPVTMPSRTAWAAQLAWCQWQPSELADGTAWKAVREVKP